MSWDAELAGMMKSAPASEMKLATMTGANTCMIGTLELTAADLYISDRLLNPICTNVSETAPADGGQCSDNSTYISALQAGDTVAAWPIKGQDGTVDKYIILAKVVSA